MVTFLNYLDLEWIYVALHKKANLLCLGSYNRTQDTRLALDNGM